MYETTLNDVQKNPIAIILTDVGGMSHGFTGRVNLAKIYENNP